MTGRDLIIYILANNLEDEPVFENGKIIGLMTLQEAAVKFNVTIATLVAWHSLGMIDWITIGNQVFIFSNAKHPHRSSV